MQQRIINDMAIPLTDAEFGTLKHALNASQTLIHKLEKYSEAVQITGAFRYLPTNGTTEIQLLAVGRRLKDLTTKFIPGADQTRLHEFLVMKKTKGLSLEDYTYTPNNRITYELTWMDYTFNILNLRSTINLPIAQIINTGPQEFTDWLTSRTVEPNALPWEYAISKPLLVLTKNQKPVKNIKIENDVFKELGYKFITLENRLHGNPDYWASFKI